MRRREAVGKAGVAAFAVGMLMVAGLGPASPVVDRGPRIRSMERAVQARAAAEATGAEVAAEGDDVAASAPSSPPAGTPAPTSTTPTTVPAPRFTLLPYQGLGAWLDVYDWTVTFGRGAPPVGPEVVGELAAQGVQTLFIQASKWDSPTDVVDPDRFLAFVDQAHQHGIAVVGWFLPTLEDPARDLQRLLAIAAMPVDGLAVDIEGRNVGDVAERNRRLVELSAALRAALPGEVIGAIPLEPVLIEDVNPGYWPGFPWAELSPSYDVWLPMGYWTNRRGPWRDAYLYTATNIDRVRERIGRPDAPVHALGGIGDNTTEADLIGFRTAAAERGAIGASIYDFRTTQGVHWPLLQLLHDPTRLPLPVSVP